MLAEATAQIVAQAITGSGRDVAGYIRQHSGVYHMTCAGQTSWHGFANEILGREANMIAQIQPIPSIEYPTPATRPAYSVLDNVQLAQAFGIALPDWITALEMVLMDN